jgi:hypothetical protein
MKPIPAATRSKAWACGRSLAAIAGWNPTGGMDICLSLSVLCCQVEIPASALSLAQRTPTACVCGVSECEREASITWRPSPTSGCRAIEKKKSDMKQ